VKGLSLAIYADPNQPDVITEAYTSSFAYHMRPHGTGDTRTGSRDKHQQVNEITAVKMRLFRSLH